MVWRLVMLRLSRFLVRVHPERLLARAAEEHVVLVPGVAGVIREVSWAIHSHIPRELGGVHTAEVPGAFHTSEVP